MKVPFFYKSLGAIRKHTLDNPLMDNYTVILNFFCDTPSLDMFAHTTTRTTVSNQFIPELDWPAPRAYEANAKNIILHQPIQEQGGLLEELVHDSFGVVLIDPPYTPLQQHALYRGSRHKKVVPPPLDTLLVATETQVERLYELCWNYAITHCHAAIVIYGYKLGVQTMDWRRSAMWAIGGGAHPAITATLFLHRQVSKEAEEALLQALHRQASSVRAEIATIEIREPPTDPPHGYHVGDSASGHLELAGNSTTYQRFRHSRDPVNFPKYLAASMHALSQRRQPTFHLHTRLAALYKHVRDSNKQEISCFPQGVRYRQVYSQHAWRDLIFVLQPRRQK